MRSLILITCFILSFSEVYCQKSIKNGYLILRLRHDSIPNTYLPTILTLDYKDQHNKLIRDKISDEFELELINNSERAFLKKNDFFRKRRLLNDCSNKYDSVLNDFEFICDSNLYKDSKSGDIFIIKLFEKMKIFYAPTKNKFRNAFGNRQSYLYDVQNERSCDLEIIKRLGYKKIEKKEIVLQMLD